MRILVFWSLAMLTCSAFLFLSFFFFFFSSSTRHFHWILSGITLGMDGISMAEWVVFTRLLIWKVLPLTYSLAIQCQWVFYAVFAGASGAGCLVFPFLNPLPTEGRLYLYLFPMPVGSYRLQPSLLPWRRQWHPTPVLLPGKSHGRRSPVGCSPWDHRVGHNCVTSLSLFTFMHWRRKWQPTPVFLPGESQGRGSLVGCRLWGPTESDTTEAT